MKKSYLSRFLYSLFFGIGMLTNFCLAADVENPPLTSETKYSENKPLGDFAKEEEIPFQPINLDSMAKKDLVEFQARTREAQEHAYNSSYTKIVGAKPLVFCPGNGGLAIGKILAEKLSNSPFAKNTIVCLSDMSPTTLTTSFDSLKKHLPSCDMKKVLKLHLGGRNNATGAGGMYEEAMRAVWAEEERVSDLIQSASYALSPNIVFCVATVGGGTGTGALIGFIDICKRKNVPVVAVVVMPQNSGGITTTAMKGLEFAISNASAVIVMSANEIINSTPGGNELGDCARMELIDEVVANRLKSILTVISPVAQGFKIPKAPDLADLMSKLGISGNGGRLSDVNGKMAFIVTGQASGAGCLKEAIINAVSKLSSEYPDFYNDILRNSEKMLIDVIYKNSANLNESIDSEVIKTLSDIGFKAGDKLFPKTGHKVQLSQDKNTPGGPQSVEVTILIGSLYLGDKIRPAAFGLGKKTGWFSWS